MDSPEEVTSPLLNAESPEVLNEVLRPSTPDLDDTFKEAQTPPPPGDEPVGVERDEGDAVNSSYKPPSSPITLPTFDDKPGDGNDVFDLGDGLSDGEEQNQNQTKRSGLITDIFGDSDEEEEEEKKGEAGPSDEGKLAEEAKEEGEADLKKPDDDEADTDEELEMLQKNDNVFVSDFDLMMERKKAERSKQMSRRKKEATDVLVLSEDDKIMCMISQMKEAASEDRRLNQNGQPAVNKLSLLQSVITQLRKHDLQTAFIECGLLPVVSEWLTPLPDNSLPHITIRTELLVMLKNFTSINAEMLKESKLGRVVMGLYKNSKETFANRESARKLIHNWARPIFGLDSKYNAMSREERIDADLRHMVKSRKRKRKSTDDGSMDVATKPGDKNFIMRARVPLPSNTDYVIRPRSKIDETVVSRRPKQNPKLEKLNKSVANRKKMSNPNHLRSSHVCVTGNKMPL